MTDLFQPAFLGLGLGAMYALSAQGLIAVFRGSGVLNFAHGAVGVIGAYTYWELRAEHDQPLLVALVAGLLVVALVGAAIHSLVMRPLRNAAPVARMVATIGVLVVVQAAVILRYGNTTKSIESELPRDLVNFAGTTISVDRLILACIACGLTMLWWGFYRFTRFGLATAAVAENQRAAAAVGVSPDRVAALNWMIGSVMAGVATILVVPIVTLQVTTGTNLMLAALAGALVAGFRSFPIAFMVGMGLGIVQTVLTMEVDLPGFASSAPFMVIVTWIVLSGRALPLRDAFLQRFPSVGSGRLRWGWMAMVSVLAVAGVLLASPRWNDALVVTFAMGVVLLSLVVLVGYAGQLSLAQFALAGFGAWVAGRAAQAWGVPFLVALLIGVVAAVPLGALFALPAVRARGVNLAIVTFGLGSAIEYMIFGNSDLVGGFNGINVGSPDLFGWSIDASRHPDRYALVCFAVLMLATIVVANIRRGRSGRRMLAVRTNERAAAALGINVVAVKVYAFAVAGGIAALGGVLVAFRSSIIVYPNTFQNFVSIQTVAWAFIGGIGYLAGPLIGATLAPGALATRIADSVTSAVADYVNLIAGCLLVLLVIVNQNGAAAGATTLARSARKRLPVAPLRSRPKDEAPPRDASTNPPEPVPPRTLRVEEISVRYGGVVAADEVSLTVTPGLVLGLIGPNGAGKTSVIDAITGFTRVHRGSVMIDDVRLTGTSPTWRARQGVARSFQSLELFEDATVRENLQTASDPHDGWSYARDLVWPANPPMSSELCEVIEEFGLADLLDRPAQELAYGQRRLLAIARAVAARPSVLLLDEPASGLGDHETREFATLVGRLATDWGMAILLVEHDMSFVMDVCDELVVLEFGRVIASGATEIVRHDPVVIDAYIGGDDGDVAGLASAPVASATGPAPDVQRAAGSA